MQEAVPSSSSLGRLHVRHHIHSEVHASKKRRKSKTNSRSTTIASRCPNCRPSQCSGLIGRAIMPLRADTTIIAAAPGESAPRVSQFHSRNRSRRHDLRGAHRCRLVQPRGSARERLADDPAAIYAVPTCRSGSGAHMPHEGKGCGQPEKGLERTSAR